MGRRLARSSANIGVVLDSRHEWMFRSFRAKGGRRGGEHIAISMFPHSLWT
jgi:hypothetical protein